MFSRGNEVLTLAFGHYSSHLATNYFNIQEASFSYNPSFSSGINHDLSFRENFRRSNTYTPRLVLVDDEESLGYLSHEGYYKGEIERVNNEAETDTNVILKEPKWEKNEYLNDFLIEKERLKSDKSCQDFLLKAHYKLDDCVVSWSDYVVTEFDEKTIVTLPKHTEYYIDYGNFTCFDAGFSLWNKTSLCDDVEERVRFFLEECDNLQGFQLLTDGGNGYSGISSGLVELLRDEYSKKAILSVPSIFLDTSLQEDVRVRNKKRCDRIYSLAASFSSYSEFCDLISPMSHVYDPWGNDPRQRRFRHVNCEQNNMYQTSALLASALDLFTLSFRLQNTSSTMNSLSTSLNVYGRCFASVGVNLPFPIHSYEGTFPSLEQIGGNFFESLTPMVDVNPDHVDIQSVCSRGLGKIPTRINAVTHHVIDREFKLYLHRLFPRVITQYSSCKSVFRAPRTFPSVLNDEFNLTKVHHEYGPLSEYVAVGGLHNTKEMHFVLNNLYEEAKNVKKRGLAGFRPRDSDVDYDRHFEYLKNTTESYLDSSFL